MSSVTKRRGFSLIELILVMVILTLLTGIFAPRFSGMLPGAKMRAASTELTSVLNKVRADASITMRRYRVHFDLSEKKYWVTVETDPFKKPNTFEKPVGALEGDFTLPEDVRIDSLTGVPQIEDGSNALTFKADGTADGATIVLSMEEGARRTFAVDAASGKITVTE